jgi:hypothetical protein
MKVNGGKRAGVGKVGEECSLLYSHTDTIRRSLSVHPEATEISHLKGGADEDWGFSRSANCYVPLKHPLANFNTPTATVDNEGHGQRHFHVNVTAEVDRNTGQYAEGGS